MRVVLILITVFVFSGCAVFNGGEECLKTVWGSSTRALERARVKAVTKTYDKSYWDVLRASLKAADKNHYTVFQKDEIKGYLVLMGIRGSVNTTEVGVFFVELGENQTRVEISSLSTNAKRYVAKALFHELDIAAGLIPQDPVEEKADVPSDNLPEAIQK